MKAGKFISLFVSIVLLGSCGICNHLPQEHIVVRDSVSISYKDSTIFHHQTVNKDYIGLLDTLRIQGAHSSMKAFADTTHFIIKGELKEEPIKEQIREKIVYKEHRDTIYIKEPYPVEIKKEVKVHYWYEKYLWFISLLALAYLGFKFYKFIMRFSGVDIGSILKKN